jgi:radical SAM-linked protein
MGFAKQGPVIWLSHLEVVRAMERCVRRSGLPYAVSQGFNPHMKHSFTAALPVGTGSNGEYMELGLASLVEPQQALCALQAVQHEHLPVLSAEYAPRDAPSLQLYYNEAGYRVVFAEASGEAGCSSSACAPECSTDSPESQTQAASPVEELLRRLHTRQSMEILKKGKPRIYDLSLYLTGAERDASDPNALLLTILSRPEGSLRPEILLAALSRPDLSLKLVSLTRVSLQHKELA